ncbi:MAG: NAD(P)-binding domain-containing protein, partial [Prevotellaceae bacterium]|nr:NAD(P)-binding domain-containing protein [Prevotellaceae bacterium]
METISLIGSGHAATHLANAFYARGYVIVDVYSRTPEHARQLAVQVNAQVAPGMCALRPADVYLIAVDDHAIPQVAQQLPLTQSLVLHTAGSVDLSALRKFPNHGVLYPLQTLSRECRVDFHTVPFFIEA